MRATRHLLLITLMLPTFAFAELPALPVKQDIIGGPTDSSFTLHHCGLLPTTGYRYTLNRQTTLMVERKLNELGYSAIADGKYTRADREAVRIFQRDRGIRVDGIVGPITARHLGQAAHPSEHVRSCEGMNSTAL